MSRADPGNVSAYLAKVRPDLKLVGIDLAEGIKHEKVTDIFCGIGFRDNKSVTFFAFWISIA